MRQYFRNWWLYLHFHWLWTREASHMHPAFMRRTNYRYIQYRPGWTPLRFLLPYCTTYLLSTFLGLGIRPFSGWLWERAVCHPCNKHANWQAAAVRLLDKLLGKGHCAQSARAPLLWISRSVWN